MIEALRRLPDWYGYLLMLLGVSLMLLVAVLAARMFPYDDND